MPSVAEIETTQGTPLNASLKAGIENISIQQTVTFTAYTRLVLPLDGFVFWVKNTLLSPSAAFNCLPFNQPPGAAISPLGGIGAPKVVSSPAPVIVARGSLHFASAKVKDETETYGVNKVTFTSEDPIHQDFNLVGGNLIYIGTFSNPKPPYETISFAFSNRNNFYKQANIFHYVGDAIYPFMQSQIISSPSALATNQIVSNSLPFWLALNNYTPSLPAYGFGNYIPLYPSHLVSSNITPPFGSVHIEPKSTIAMASVPYIGRLSSHYQSTIDDVKITLYGVDNAHAMNLVDCVLQRSKDYGQFGVMNCPIIRDEKAAQNELGIIAQKKSINFTVNYHQASVRDIVRQIICRAIVDYEPISPQFSWADPLARTNL